MNTARQSLFPPGGSAGMPGASGQGGLLPGQDLQRLIEEGRGIRPAEPLQPGQIQPASLDLRLGRRAFRVRASFLPGGHASVQQKIDQFAMHAFELGEQGTVLEKGCVYIVELIESLALAPDQSALANPKSSIGRIDVFTRLITDHGMAFDHVRAGYQGPLYAEISPRTFSILARRGDRLNQIRLRQARPAASTCDETGAGREGVPVSVDLAGDGVIGYRARKHAGLIDLRKLGHYEVEDFWHPLRARRDRTLVLDPDEFYILASKEAVRIPPDQAAEMLAYDTSIGEFRVHYAGFFDPGFGHGAAEGTRAVLEVRSHEVPFVLEHGQRVGRLIYERLSAPPEQLYGEGIGSNYQHQGLRLSKHFSTKAAR
ncbi:MAG: 2'-deoxycytidine 5'-triphosphate deaminase [Alphaproteobacteria bacterium]